MDIPIGKVLQYYEKSGSVAIEVLQQQLQVGDRIRINNHESIIEEIKIGSEIVMTVEPEDECVIKIPTRATAGDVLYLI